MFFFSTPEKAICADDDDEGIDTFDFSLPGDVTGYVISVSFDDNGNVRGITKESSSQPPGGGSLTALTMPNARASYQA